MPQSPTDSLSTIEDNTLYEGVYNAKEGVPREWSREEVCGEEQSQLADPHGGVLSQTGLVSQGGKRVDRFNKKRVHFQDLDSDVDDSRPSARKVSKTEGSSALLATKIQVLEARVEALEEWKAKCEKAVQKKAKMNKEFRQDLTALLKASNTGE